MTEDIVTITCPGCGHTETMSVEQAEKYEVANDQMCDDCFDKIVKEGQ